MMFWKGNQRKLKAIRYVEIQNETFFCLKKLILGLRKWNFRKISRIIRNHVKHHQNMKTSRNRWFWIHFNDKNYWKIKNSKISIVNLSFLKNEFRKQFATKFHFSGSFGYINIKIRWQAFFLWAKSILPYWQCLCHVPFFCIVNEGANEGSEDE